MDDSPRHSAGLRRVGQVIACDIAVPRGAIPLLRKRVILRVQAGWPQLQVCDFGHVGDGGMHFNFVVPDGDKPLGAEDVTKVRDAVYAIVDELSGVFSAEHGVGPLNGPFYDKYIPEKIRQLSAAIQATTQKQLFGRVDLGGFDTTWAQ